MAIISRIKDYFFQKQLINQRSDASYAQPLQLIQTLVFVVREANQDQLLTLKQWAHLRFESLETLKVIHFVNDPQEPIENTLYISSKKDIKWNRCLRQPLTDQLKSEGFDLMINLDRQKDLSMLYTSSVIPAQLKIGFCPNPWKVYDLLLEADQGSLNDQLHQISDILTKINADI